MWVYTFLTRIGLLEASYKIFSSSFVIVCHSRYFPVSLCFGSLQGLFANCPHVGSKCEIHSTFVTHLLSHVTLPLEEKPGLGKQ